MYGKRYVAVGGKAPRQGALYWKAPRTDVQMAGNLDNVSMKGSVTGTKIKTETVYLNILYSSIN
jgi:hypothetical protein